MSNIDDRYGQNPTNTVYRQCIEVLYCMVNTDGWYGQFLYHASIVNKSIM